jgi:outer membrane lipoprotein carrier protein
MRITVSTILLLATLLLLPAAALSSRDQTLEGLETLRRGLAGMQDFSADITQEKQLSLLKRKMTARGVVRFKKPGSFFMEIYPPYASRLLVKENVLEIFQPGEGIRQRIPLPPEESLDRWFGYLSRPVTALPEGMTIRAERRYGEWNLHILPQGKGGVKEVQIDFGVDGKLRRLAIEERNRDRTVIRFHNLRPNAGLQDKDFLLE